MHQAGIEQVRPAAGKTAEAAQAVDACVAGSRRRAFRCYRIPGFQIQTLTPTGGGRGGSRHGNPEKQKEGSMENNKALGMGGFRENPNKNQNHNQTSNHSGSNKIRTSEKQRRAKQRKRKTNEQTSILSAFFDFMRNLTNVNIRTSKQIQQSNYACSYFDSKWGPETVVDSQQMRK